MTKIFSRLHILFFLAAFFSFFATPAHATEKIGVIYRGDFELHQHIADELYTSIKGDNAHTTVLWNLEPDGTEEDQQFFRDEQFSQLIAIGDLALSYCMENYHDTQGIFLLVSSTDLAKKAESLHWQGVRIWTPMAEQFSKIKEFLPDTKSLGVLISPKCQADKTLLKNTASEFGLTLNLITIKNRRQVLPSLSKIFRQNDAIFMLPDPGILNNVVLTEMLRLQKKHRTPLIAVSKRFVNAGAFMSVDYKLKELIAEITKIITHSPSEESDPPFLNCCLVVHINPKAADQLRIKIPTNTETHIEFIPQDTGDQT
jgi:ABC-type uncharacterized transport system substrate-binding protein